MSGCLLKLFRQAIHCKERTGKVQIIFLRRKKFGCRWHTFCTNSLLLVISKTIASCEFFEGSNSCSEEKKLFLRFRKNTNLSFFLLRIIAPKSSIGTNCQSRKTGFWMHKVVIIRTSFFSATNYFRLVLAPYINFCKKRRVNHLKTLNIFKPATAEKYAFLDFFHFVPCLDIFQTKCVESALSSFAEIYFSRSLFCTASL